MEPDTDTADRPSGRWWWAQAAVAVAAVLAAAVIARPGPAPDAVVYPLAGTDWRMVAVVADRPFTHAEPVVELAAGLPGPGVAGDADAERSAHEAAAYTTSVLGETVDPVPLGDLHGPSGALVLALASMEVATGGDWSPVPLAATGDLLHGWVRPVGKVPTKVHAAHATGAALVFVPATAASSLLPASTWRDGPAMRDEGRDWVAAGRPFTIVAVTHVADVLWFVCGAFPGPVCELADRAEQAIG